MSTIPTTVGARIREMQATIQAEARQALEAHLASLRETAQVSLDLATLDVYNDRVREALNRSATSLSTEANAMQRWLENYSSEPREIAA